MEGKKQLLIKLIVDRNVSAIETVREKLGLSKEQVISLIEELQNEGRLHGTITSDEKRFFKSDVKMSQAPVIGHEDTAPAFLDYDVRPGITIATAGFGIILVGVVFNSFIFMQGSSDIAALCFFIGAFILIIGLFLIARRKTPD